MVNLPMQLKLMFHQNATLHQSLLELEAKLRAMVLYNAPCGLT